MRQTSSCFSEIYFEIVFRAHESCLPHYLYVECQQLLFIVQKQLLQRLPALCPRFVVVGTNRQDIEVGSWPVIIIVVHELHFAGRDDTRLRLAFVDEFVSNSICATHLKPAFHRLALAWHKLYERGSGSTLRHWRNVPRFLSLKVISNRSVLDIAHRCKAKGSKRIRGHTRLEAFTR